MAYRPAAESHSAASKHLNKWPRLEKSVNQNGKQWQHIAATCMLATLISH